MDAENRSAQPLDEEEDYEPDILTLEDEEGREHAFEVMDATDIEGVRYLAVVPYHEDPADALEDDGEMLIMRVGEEDGEEFLDVVEDDEELLSVGQVFLNRLSEVYDIDLDELRRQSGE
ncbi:DUF1292 domain-containing protein [Ruminococcaceae bacterium OttesenSCG-928-A11]|nr:DUF1292 domain-containing protein [Ruminococcaceae bacterium OttesenSCG-928-A11]